MTKLSVLLIALPLLSGSLTTTAQTQDRTKGEARIFPVELLPGYRVETRSGIDTWGATIWKDGGAKIEMYQGLHVGIAADLVKAEDVAWREEQVVNGQRVICAYTKSNDLVVSIPRQIVNFQSQIRDQQDLTEMLLMVLTYEPTHGYSVEPGTVVRAPQAPK
jgi:hypothetical protein